MKWTLAILLILFIGFNLSAQSSRLSTFFIRKNTDKLTRKITRHAKTDREKVHAIHHWITHNIKYDVKKFLKRDYHVIPTSRILKKRKAICTGYSDLFSEMCGYLNIPAHNVAGYTKNQDVDICDSFYLDDHAWNAVKLDSTWLLIDNTWDAGYIKWYKQTTLSKILNKGLGIPYVVYKYKPKFKFAPHETYYIKSGHFFSTNHLPSLPIWQLTDTLITIRDFRKDSTDYYLNFKEDIKPILINDAAIQAYLNKTEQDKLIAKGKPIYDFNNRNPLSLSISYFTNAKKEMEGATGVPEELIITTRKAIAMAQSATSFCDSTAKLLDIQQESLIRNNNAKIGLQKQYNKSFLRYAKKSISISKYNIKSTKKKKKSYQKSKVANRKSFHKTAINSSLSKKEFKHKYSSVNDSIKTEKNCDSLEVIFRLASLNLTLSLTKLDSIQKRYAKSLNQERNYILKIKNHFIGLVQTRLFGYDDYDYPIKRTKASFHYPDSFLFVDNQKIYRIINVYLREAKSEIRSFKSAYKKYTREMGKLKKMQTQNSVLPDRWQKANAIFTFQENETSQWFNGVLKMYTDAKVGYKRIVKLEKKTIRIIKQEKEIYKSNSAIRFHISSLKRVNKSVASKARRFTSKKLKQVKKLEKLLEVKQKQ